ncbi:hypothetical protein [Brevundimonas bacteroides]|uniref:hypothetical protein n=1 Tax=Brevundimonas bacteroides TaxID=74311 RepID=UPI0004963170|nr:hypothetical protein [Brevundimonas bacteroides]
MTSDPMADRALSAFFADALPPARDLAFEARVAAKIARRRAVATVAALVPWTIAASVLLWVLGPLLGPVVDGLAETLAPAATILALTALAVVTSVAAGRRLSPIG